MAELSLSDLRAIADANRGDTPLRFNPEGPVPNAADEASTVVARVTPNDPKPFQLTKPRWGGFGMLLRGDLSAHSVVKDQTEPKTPVEPAASAHAETPRMVSTPDPAVAGDRARTVPARTVSEAETVYSGGDSMANAEARLTPQQEMVPTPETEAIEYDAEKLLLRLGEINNLPAEEAEKLLAEVKELFSRVSRVFTETVPRSLIEFGAMIAYRDPDLMRAFRKTAALTATFGISLTALAVAPELALTAAVIVGGTEATKRGWRRGFQGVGRLFSGLPQIVRGLGWGMRKAGSAMAVVGGGNRVIAPAEPGGIQGLGEAGVTAMVNVADAPLKAHEAALETAKQTKIGQRRSELKVLISTLISPDAGKGEVHRARVNAENLLHELEVLEMGAETADSLHSLYDFTVEVINGCLEDGIVDTSDREKIASALALTLNTATEDQKKMAIEKIRLESKQKRVEELRESIESRRVEFQNGTRPRYRVKDLGRGRDNWTADYAQWRKDVAFVARNSRNQEE